MTYEVYYRKPRTVTRPDMVVATETEMVDTITANFIEVRDGAVIFSNTSIISVYPLRNIVRVLEKRSDN